MKPLPRAKTVDKVEQAVAALQEYIIGGNLAPGTPLPSESDMAKQIGVSKFSMREALRVAQSQGLLEISQGRRTKVADVSVKPAAGIMGLIMKRSRLLLLELTEARQSLECAIVYFAAMRAKDEHIEKMEETIEDLDKNRDSIPFCVDKDIEFHDIMAQATKNRVFEMLLISLAELSRESRMETMRISGIDKPITEHRAILAAIKAGDPKQAVESMKAHLRTAESNLKEMDRPE